MSKKVYYQFYTTCVHPELVSMNEPIPFFSEVGNSNIITNEYTKLIFNGKNRSFKLTFYGVLSNYSTSNQVEVYLLVNNTRVPGAKAISSVSSNETTTLSFATSLSLCCKTEKTEVSVVTSTGIYLQVANLVVEEI